MVTLPGTLCASCTSMNFNCAAICMALPHECTILTTSVQAFMHLSTMLPKSCPLCENLRDPS